MFRLSAEERARECFLKALLLIDLLRKDAATALTKFDEIITRKGLLING